jgi:hypothetical protein
MRVSRRNPAWGGGRTGFESFTPIQLLAPWAGRVCAGSRVVHSTIRQLDHSTTRSFDNSTTRPFDHSTARPLDRSTIRPRRYSAWY